MIPPCALTGRCWRQFPDRLREHDRMPHQARKTGFGQPDSSRFARLEERAYTERPPLSRRLPDGGPSRPARDRMAAASRLRPLPTRIPASAAILPETCTVRSTMPGVDNLAAEYGTPRPVGHVRPFRRSRSPLSRPFRAKSGMPTQPCPRVLPFFISTMKLKRGVIMAENTRSPSILRCGPSA